MLILKAAYIGCTDHHGRLWVAGQQQLASFHHVYAIHYRLLLPWAGNWGFVGGCVVSLGIRNQASVVFSCYVVFLVDMICEVCQAMMCKSLKGAQPSKRSPSTMKEKVTLQLLRIDWIGGSLFVAQGKLILLALNWGSNEKWNSVKVIATFVIGRVLLVAFLFWEYLLELQEIKLVSCSREVLWAYPMLPLEVFRSFDVCVVQYTSFVGGLGQ